MSDIAHASEHPHTQHPATLGIAFIGGGNMARSLIGGLLAAGHHAEQISVAEPDAGQRERLQALGPLRLGADNQAAVRDADIIVLAVKPQVLGTVCTALRPALRSAGPISGASDQLVVSIAAGVRLQAMQQWLGDCAIVRCMPNTPALLRAGITVLTGNARVSPQQMSLASALLRAVGQCEVVDDENLLDPVTAISGSGPAYFFLFMEALTAAAIAQGLDPEQARRLVVATALGAARMANETSSTLEALRVSVTSPNGTTERALQAFEKGDLRSLVATAALAARDRSIEMADELGSHR